ncbi:type II secretion system F family protein [Microbacterium sp. SS28]|uniref:type II secretion system F family protein n=1 Tax=Microbacterium sp. SS28 TaxID=2919948 RepID=UPI001FAB04FD|nr:type II secretion system F family protein [Microbacterium sp. SS28]
MRRRSSAPSADEAADAVLRLAVLLQSGMAPARAWQIAAETGEPIAARVHRDAAERSLVEAIAVQGGAWRDVAAAWAIATTVGAPLSDSLRAIAGALRDAQEAADDARLALAEPAGTARLMAWLPLVAIALGAALGFDTAVTLVTNPLGIACLAAGIALVLVAHRWTAALVRRAAPAPGTPGLAAELLAIAVAGGVSLDRAREVVARSGGPAPDAAVEEVLHLSQRAGIPAIELLKAAAALARHRARIDGRLRAARLSSRLLVPLGVCTLPAFLLLGVAPMLLSVMSTMSISL